MIVHCAFTKGYRQVISTSHLVHINRNFNTIPKCFIANLIVMKLNKSFTNSSIHHQNDQIQGTISHFNKWHNCFSSHKICSFQASQHTFLFSFSASFSSKLFIFFKTKTFSWRLDSCKGLFYKFKTYYVQNIQKELFMLFLCTHNSFCNWLRNSKQYTDGEINIFICQF